MNPGSNELERLISRFLDDEATPDERRTLRALERSDPGVAALINEYAELDREVGHAMRSAMGQTIAFRPLRSPWARVAQFAALAAAACVAAMIWVGPVRHPVSDARQTVHAGNSWFAPDQTRPPRDSQERIDPSYERPQLRLRDTDRDWLVVPGNRPGEYMVIEINRMRTHAIRIQSDF